MTKKILFSLIWLCFSGLLFAPLTLKSTQLSSVAPCQCNLLPPANLHATRVGTVTADIAWDTVHGAGGYRVKVYQKVGAGYFFLYEVNHFSTTMTVTGLILDSDHRVTVAGMCWCNGTGGEGYWVESPNSAFVELDKIILDLDIINFAPMPSTISEAKCVWGENDECCAYEFTEDNGKRLWVKVVNNISETCNIHPIHVSEGGNATLMRATNQTDHCENLMTTKNVGYIGSQLTFQQGVKIDYGVIQHIGRNVTEAIRIDAYGPPVGSVTHICVSSLDPAYSFVVYEEHGLGFGPPNGGDRNELQKVSTPNIYPINPFAENLDVIDTSPSGLSIKLQLFDLNGRLKITQHYEVGQGFYSMPTPNLAPGMYILRMESGDEIQTFKVIKTQN